MKISIFSIILIFLYTISGCKETAIENPDVENYVNLLKSGQYTSYEMPAFSPSDIPALLVYRNDTSTIRQFPVNPISSFWMMKCSLGVVVLWTVESIRVVENGTEKLIGRFPSQNPLFALKKDPAVWVFDVKAQYKAAKAYYDWWKSDPLFRNKMNIDPLKNTDYIWH